MKCPVLVVARVDSASRRLVSLCLANRIGTVTLFPDALSAGMVGVYSSCE